MSEHQQSRGAEEEFYRMNTCMKPDGMATKQKNMDTSQMISQKQNRNAYSYKLILFERTMNSAVSKRIP